MPKGAERILPDSVPVEFGQAFDKLLAEGQGKIEGRDREVLAWSGNYKTAANISNLTNQLQKNFRGAGWQYEALERNGDLQVFSLIKQGSPNRLVLGFFVPGDDVLVCALMEVVEGVTESTQSVAPERTVVDQPTKPDGSTQPIVVDADTQWINVMGNEMPPMPDFPKLAPKPGRVRGYVKDSTGKPLAGAEIGVRSSYLAGYYSGSQGKTDANGYYEFVVPKGSAHYYNAGYQINWGDGVAAVSLHPADGSLDAFVTMDGAVENFVMLPYGITSRENLQQYSHLPATFYGGAIFLGWYGVEANDNNAPPLSVRMGSTLEITLIPESGRTFVIRKTIGVSNGFRIHNIPLGRYQITIKLNGKPVKLKDDKKYDPLFGMSPVEANGTASILFIPDQAKASMVGPQQGAWKWLDIGITPQ
ncbi:MAG: hypothetical protein DMF63_01605 [Acidobacteria bacterium]|nr:MAG: hypothetical protein DMF63_01605 [Acidobacteriota bacterium]